MKYKVESVWIYKGFFYTKQLIMEIKKSFILYSDLIESVEELSDEDAGQLFKHILNYVNLKKPVSENPFVRLSFIPIKQSLKRDLEKWTGTREKRSVAGKASAESRKKKKEEKEKKETISTKSANVESVDSDSTKSTVNVTDTVNVNETVNVNDNDKEKDVLLSSISFTDEVLISSQFNRIAFNFFNLVKQNLLDSGLSKSKTLEKAKLSEWSKHIQLMFEKDERTIEEYKIVKSFLKTNEFWKKNILSTKKLRIQFEKLYLNAKQHNQNGKTQSDATTKNGIDSKERTKRMVEKLHNNIKEDKQE